jgi:predicted nucleic acid-binding protein
VTAIDANVLVRLLVRDHEAQYRRAYALFQNEEVYIPDTVVLEAEWVLRFAYDYSAPEICAAFRGVFGLKNVHLQDPPMMSKVLDWHEMGLDFADALHLAKSEQLGQLKTFDAKFVKNAKGLCPCQVTKCG